MSELLTTETLPPEILTYTGQTERLTYPLRQGYASSVALLECERGYLVVKRSIGPRFGAMLQREYQILNILSLYTTLLVPHPYLFLEKSGTNWLVMDWLPGVPMRERLVGETNSLRRDLIIESFGKTLAEIHATNLTPGLLNTRDNWLDRKLETAAVNLADNFTRSDATAALLEELKKDRPAPITQTLIHGDYTIDNVLVLRNEVSAIIDWSTGAWGDPRYDLRAAIRPVPLLFEPSRDQAAFFSGYGQSSLTPADNDFFFKLHLFF